MRGLARRACLAATVGAAIAGCGDESVDPAKPSARAPGPPPQLAVTPADRRAWAPAPARADVPVILFSAVPRARLARALTLLDVAGHETIPLADLDRRNRHPPRPVEITFDGGRAASWLDADATLEKLGFTAVVFVDVGRVEARAPGYLSWRELNRMQRSGRWDVQLQSGTGNRLIKYGPNPGDRGPFYAYRGADERIDGWRERVFSDITDAEKLLAHRVPSYRPVAFAPPYGNYGQAGTNDPRIPRLLRERLKLSFDLIVTDRIEVTAGTSDRELRERLR